MDNAKKSVKASSKVTEKEHELGEAMDAYCDPRHPEWDPAFALWAVYADSISSSPRWTGEERAQLAIFITDAYRQKVLDCCYTALVDSCDLPPHRLVVNYLATGLQPYLTKPLARNLVMSALDGTLDEVVDDIS